MNTPGIIAHQTITTIIDNVEQAQHDITEAFNQLAQAKARLTAVLGDGHTSYYGHIWESTISDYNLERNGAESCAFVTKNAWRYVIEQTGLQAFMTRARQEELQKQLEKGNLPALTVANVLSTLEGLTSQVGTLLEESIAEVFQWLTPRHAWGVGKLKTNSTFKIGKKVIVGGAVEPGWTRGFKLNTYREASFRALGNVLSLLDGQGAQKYPDDLCTQLRVALEPCKAGNWVSVPYLTVKPFRNGHMHIVFERGDLLDKLNARSGDGVSLDK